MGSYEEVVCVARLDDVMNKHLTDLNEPRVFLKMDTQGYDLEVFAGLDSRRGNVCALQSEVSVIPIYEGMSDMKEAIANYEQAGFELAGLYPVTHDEKAAKVIEFDCIMVNARSF